MKDKAKGPGGNNSPASPQQRRPHMIKLTSGFQCNFVYLCVTALDQIHC